MKKRLLIISVLALAIGFASITASLATEGKINLSFESNDFDVKFTKVFIDDRVSSNANILDNGKKIKFDMDTLRRIGETTTLSFDVKNNSTQYDANVRITCSYGDNDYIRVTSEFAGEILPMTNPKKMLAKETTSGSLTAEMIKSFVGDDNRITITCELTADALSSDTKVEVEEVDLSSKNSVWFGDSWMAGSGNTEHSTNFNGTDEFKSFHTYYRETVGATVYNTFNVASGGETFTDNDNKSIYKQIVATATQLGKDYTTTDGEHKKIPTGEEVDFVVLDGGGNDIIKYDAGGADMSLKKEVGTAEDTTSDTVINDFRKTIDLIKSTFPNAKILYLFPGVIDSGTLERITLAGKTIDDLNAIYGTSFKTKTEFRYAYFHDTAYAEVEEIKNVREVINGLNTRATNLMAEIKKVAEEVGIEYLYTGDIIASARTNDGTDTNPYIQADEVHITAEGYKALNPYIVAKIKEMFK